jgi:hypothetical protein
LVLPKLYAAAWAAASDEFTSERSEGGPWPSKMGAALLK